MKRLMGSFVAVLMLAALALAAQERGDNKSKDTPKAAAKPPRAVYQHTTSAGRLGKFELNGERGKADYYFNGQHHQDELVFTRAAQMASGPTPEAMPGWVYQVATKDKDKDKDKKESIWFFFADVPLARGGDQYAMYYSTTPPNQEGKQPWMRILTPGGTRRTPLDQKDKPKGINGATK
jgi:hypothetical protein